MSSDPSPTPHLYDGTFFQPVDTTGESFRIQCLLCDAREKNIIKASKESNSNVWSHLKVRIILLDIIASSH